MSASQPRGLTQCWGGGAPEPAGSQASDGQQDSPQSGTPRGQDKEQFVFVKEPLSREQHSTNVRSGHCPVPEVPSSAVSGPAVALRLLPGALPLLLLASSPHRTPPPPEPERLVGKPRAQHGCAWGHRDPQGSEWPKTTQDWGCCCHDHLYSLPAPAVPRPCWAPPAHLRQGHQPTHQSSLKPCPTPCPAEAKSPAGSPPAPPRLLPGGPGLSKSHAGRQRAAPGPSAFPSRPAGTWCGAEPVPRRLGQVASSSSRKALPRGPGSPPSDTPSAVGGGGVSERVQTASCPARLPRC